MKYLSNCLCLVLLFGWIGATQGEERLRDLIDQQIESAWQAEKLTPAERSTDAEFLRRVYLDLLGIIPSYEQTTAFLGDANPDKRERLIAQLFQHPRYGVHQSDVWDMVYFGRNPPGFGTKDRDGFKNWLREQFDQNVPYDVWAGKILRAEGNTVEHGAPMFYLQYKNAPEDATQAVTQHFLGVQLQCARCHDHPFDQWTQLDFYGMAAFFARLAVIAQIGYFTVIHPGWPEYMLGETERHFQSQGLSAAEVQAQVEIARQTFELTNYAMQSAVMAIVLGLVLSAIVMVFLRSKPVTHSRA